MGRKTLGWLALATLAFGPAQKAKAQQQASLLPAQSAPAIPRVRSEDAVIAALIVRAAEGSPVFQRLVEEVDATDGIVYVQRGECRHGGAACLALGVTVAGPNRILRAIVNLRFFDCEVNLMASIGHELQHALEILRVPSLTSGASVFHYYAREGRHSNQADFTFGGWETHAALETGFKVLKELRSASTERGRPCKDGRLRADAPPK